jgi:hypothetical protein
MTESGYDALLCCNLEAQVGEQEIHTTHSQLPSGVPAFDLMQQAENGNHRFTVCVEDSLSWFHRSVGSSITL